MRREESDSASYVRLHHRDSDPPRHANTSLTTDATLLVPQPSNPAIPDSVLSALLLQMKQLSSVLVAQDANRMTESKLLAEQFAAQSAAMTAISDRLNRLEHSRSDRSDRESASMQSVPLPPPPARHSRRRITRVEMRSRPHGPRKCGPRPDEILRITDVAVCESFARVKLGLS